MEKKVILCVDDEKIILDTLKITLRRTFSDYHIEFAESGEEALSLLDEYIDAPINKLVVISDWLMPGMRGDEFLIKVHRKYPKSIKIILSGLIDASRIEEVREKVNIYKVISKPWNGEELIATVKKAFLEQQ